MTVQAIPEVGDALSHYGRKGMKWGQRIFTSGKGSSSSSSKETKTEKKDAPSEDYTRAAAARSKPSYAMSNAEMRDLITRIRLEGEYATLIAPPKAPPKKPGVVSRTARSTGKFAKDVAIDVARTETRRVSKAAGQLAVNRALSSDAKSQGPFMKELGKSLYKPPKPQKDKKPNN